MATYVRGSGSDNWHWGTNCSQWPNNIVERRKERPQSDLCNQCKSKERDKECSVNP